MCVVAAADAAATAENAYCADVTVYTEAVASPAVAAATAAAVATSTSGQNHVNRFR